MATLEDKSLWEAENAEDDDIGQDILRLSPEEVTNRTRLLENDVKVMKSEIVRLQHEQAAMKERIKDNKEKIKMNKQLPYLVGNVVEVKIKIKPQTKTCICLYRN
jgi:26S proteasome regulatory subunit T5